MKKLWDDENKDKLYPIYSKYITEEQFNELIDRLNTEIADRINGDTENSDNLNNHIASIAIEVTTALLTATQASITDADITRIVSETVETSTIEADVARINYSELTRTVIDNLTATDGNIDVLKTRELESTTVKATNANIDDATIDKLKANEIDCPSITIDKVVTSGIATKTVQTDYTVSDNILSEDIHTKKLLADEADIPSLVSSVIDIHRITHSREPIEVAQVLEGDYWVEVPYFTNGTYRLIATDYNNDLIWAINIHNQVAHPWFEWSYKETTPIQIKYIPEVVVRDRDEHPILFIHISGVEDPHKIYWATDTFEGTNTVTVLDTFELITDRDKEYKTTEKAGIYFTGEIIMEKDAAEVEPLILKSTSIFEDITVDASAYDGTLRVERTEYRPDQPVNTDSDVTFENATVSSLTENRTTESYFIKTDEDKKLVSVKEAAIVDGVSTEDGDQIITARRLNDWDGSSADGNAITKLGIVNKGSIDTNNNDYIKQPHFYVGPTLDSLDSVELDTVLIERDI